MLLGLFRRDPNRAAVAALYAQVAAAARHPALYRDLNVPDTLEGRFEILVLHVLLTLRRLRGLPPPADDLAQDLTDLTFKEFDRALRETGVGDTVVPKRMKKLAQSFYGRARAYDLPIASGDDGALDQALRRNLTGGAEAGGLVAYARAAEASLARQNLDDLLRAGPAFPDPSRAAAPPS